MCTQSRNLLGGDLQVGFGDSKSERGGWTLPLFILIPHWVAPDPVWWEATVRVLRIEVSGSTYPILQAPARSVYRVRMETGSPPGNLKLKEATKNQVTGS